MATLKELRDERVRKLQELKELGLEAYPATAVRTHMNSAIVDRFDQLDGSEVTVVGRIANIRKFGKLAFLVVRDASGSLQLFLSDALMGGLDAEQGTIGIAQLPLLDAGDFVEATGKVVKTKSGEVSVEAARLRLLGKSLRPLPTAQDGFTNKEERLRRRYIDTNVNRDVYERYVRRSNFWQATRSFLLKHDFIEINIPVLEQTTGGADATPFVTHMDALDQDFYLRISHELPLKRLLGGGYEKVFDIGPRFRNENYSDEHLPEHVAMEWYWAYANWQDGMKLTQDMTRYVADMTWGRREFTFTNGLSADLGRDGEDWPRISFVDVIQEHFGIDVFNTTIEEVSSALREHKIEVEKTDSIPRGIDKLWKKVRVTLPGPAFLVDIPTFLQPLAKTQPGKPHLTEQFNLILGGTEACKAYSELNDPVDQLDRFVQQQAMRDAGDSEAMMLDIDYVEMLEYGMPPACGFGWSERVFWMCEGVTAREGVPFPALRHGIDEVTRSIYPDVLLSPSESKEPAAIDRTKLPASAAAQGTRKLYLDDYAMLETDATVVAVDDLGEGTQRIVLDQSVVYPGGGGQDFDLGTLSWAEGSLAIQETSKDQAGVIFHDGVIDGSAPAVGSTVHAVVDSERRLLNSRLHCAGHLIDYALRQAGISWRPGKGAHYPHMSFVEYDGSLESIDTDGLARQIEATLRTVTENGGHVESKIVPAEQAAEYSDYIPRAVVDAYQNVHIAMYPDNFNICCGGTHLSDLHLLGSVTISKIKKKDKAIRVSYQLAD